MTNDSVRINDGNLCPLRREQTSQGKTDWASPDDDNLVRRV
jgi:hypothetical protein